ncbi:PIN domain-containing protein [Stenotrophomonas lactitubi]|uniref:PIN domain-containing protein n=1 Tax=Stenotrophomonas lactitubi TaxID=2045214 RepID=UPI0032095023
MYVFDTGSYSKLKHYYPQVFGSLWRHLGALAQSGAIVSTREVRRELGNGSPVPYVTEWLDANAQMFATPTADELQFVARILAIPHFQSIIGEQQRLTGMPVADPFVIAAGAIRSFTVVTEEHFKQNAAKIPNVCQHFSVPCINLEQFMAQEQLSF